MEHSRNAKRDRTAEWVEQQSMMRYSTQSFDPPSSVAIPSSSSASRTSSSNHTASWSEQSIAGPSSSRQRGTSTVPSVSKQIPLVATGNGCLQDQQRTLAFPRSPPGSGYPMAMEVASPPRAEATRVSTRSVLYCHCIDILIDP